MNNEKNEELLSEYPGRDYLEVMNKQALVDNQIEQITKHYGDEINVHNQLIEETLPGGKYPFADELKELLESRDIELFPLTNKQKELSAKLEQLHTGAWNGALKKERIDNQYQEHQIALSVVHEMHKGILDMHKEIQVVNEQFGRVVKEAALLAVKLEKMLEKDETTNAEELEIRELAKALNELYEYIAYHKHKWVHTGQKLKSEYN